MKKELLTGNQATIKGALAAQAEMMTGYPITPTTEIIEAWAEEAVKNHQLKFLQTEDEMAAGFAMIGGILAGKKSFTATAGPGNVLLQDPMAMAENMRLPTVAFINQRGGPSTGTVIYSQQEVNLTCFGGNGEGLRIVYSASSVQEMFDFAIKGFNAAWKYRFPTFILSDGYLAKTLTEIETYDPLERQIEINSSPPFVLNSKKQPGTYTNLRNTYNLESELNKLLQNHQTDFNNIISEVVEYEDYHTLDAEIIIVAHGSPASASREAINRLRMDNIKVGLFRPITLNPFPKTTITSILKNKKRLLVIESSLGQLEKMVKANIYGEEIPISLYQKPALGITPEEIINVVKDIVKETK